MKTFFRPAQVRMFLGLGAVVLIAALSSSQPVPREKVGFLPDGGFLLNSGWRVKPAGTQVPLDTLPMSSRFAVTRTAPVASELQRRASAVSRVRVSPIMTEPTMAVRSRAVPSVSATS